jgi:hypothetical protein
VRIRYSLSLKPPPVMAVVANKRARQSPCPEAARAEAMPYEFFDWLRRRHILAHGAALAALCWLLWCNLRPVAVVTERETLFTHGWPVQTRLFWIYHGGRWHPDEFPMGMVAAFTADSLFALLVVFVVYAVLDWPLRRLSRGWVEPDVQE